MGTWSLFFVNFGSRALVATSDSSIIAEILRKYREYQAHVEELSEYLRRDGVIYPL